MTFNAIKRYRTIYWPEKIHPRLFSASRLFSTRCWFQSVWLQ